MVDVQCSAEGWNPYMRAIAFKHMEGGNWLPVYKWSEGATLKSVNQASANLENPLEKPQVHIGTHPPYGEKLSSRHPPYGDA